MVYIAVNDVICWRKKLQYGSEMFLGDSLDLGRWTHPILGIVLNPYHYELFYTLIKHLSADVI